MATDAATILSQSGCDDCVGLGPSQQQLIRLALLRQWLLALDPSAMTDAQSLLSDASASCYDCFLPQGALMELGLLRKIAIALGASGTDAQTLLSQAGCDDCYQQLGLIELGLLRKIAIAAGAAP